MIEEKIIKKYHCPRCKTTKVVEYPDSIECPNCLLEFDKDLFGMEQDENMMSRQELGDFFNSFTDQEKKELFEKEL